MNGWFAIKHGIRNHPIFKGRLDRLGAWVAMLDEAAFADTRQDVGGVIIPVKRGQLCASQAMLSEITGLSRQQLRTFLTALEAEGAIKTQTATKSTKSRTIITFCNYGKYQDPQPKANQEPTKGQPIKEQDNNIPVGKRADAPSVDPAKIIFDQGVVLLGQSGLSDKQARSTLGGWRKRYGDDALIAALGRCQREGAINPVEFIPGCLKFHRTNSPKPGSGVSDAGAFGRLKEYAG